MVIGAGGPPKREVHKGVPHPSAVLGARVGFSFVPDRLPAVYSACGPVGLDLVAPVVYVCRHALGFTPLPAGRGLTLRNVQLLPADAIAQPGDTYPSKPKTGLAGDPADCLNMRQKALLASVSSG
jgi:hypothetical protein